MQFQQRLQLRYLVLKFLLIQTSTTSASVASQIPTSTIAIATATTASDSSTGLSGGVIGGIAGGIAGGFAFLGAILFYFYRRIRKVARTYSMHSMSERPPVDDSAFEREPPKEEPVRVQSLRYPEEDFGMLSGRVRED
jgi:predicted lipid-binding transport protein (Tim44 family)